LSAGFDGKVLRAKAGNFITNASIEITAGNHKTFVTEDI
jgi:hypothetical protein